jgi:hypothetical protein
MNTFDQLVWQQVQTVRPSSIVLDKLHARAIIQDRVDALRSDKMDVLDTLVQIAAAAQICAEQLLLLRQQEEAPKQSDLQHELESIVQHILDNITVAQPKQRGVSRQVCEIDTEFLEKLKDIV